MNNDQARYDFVYRYVRQHVRTIACPCCNHTGYHAEALMEHLRDAHGYTDHTWKYK